MSLMSQGEIRIFTCLKEFIGHLSQFYFSEFIVASLKKKWNSFERKHFKGTLRKKCLIILSTNKSSSKNILIGLD